jgi:hypothetical protein
VDWLRGMTQFIDVVTRAVCASGRSRLPIEEAGDKAHCRDTHRCVATVSA